MSTGVLGFGSLPLVSLLAFFLGFFSHFSLPNTFFPRAGIAFFAGSAIGESKDLCLSHTCPSEDRFLEVETLLHEDHHLSISRMDIDLLNGQPMLVPIQNLIDFICIQPVHNLKSHRFNLSRLKILW